MRGKPGLAKIRVTRNLYLKVWLMWSVALTTVFSLQIS